MISFGFYCKYLYNTNVSKLNNLIFRNMINEKKVIELFIQGWDEVSTDTKIAINNEYCRENGYENEIFGNTDDFLDEMFSSPSEAIKAVSYGEYCCSDDYVWFNGYSNLESGSFESNLPLEDARTLAEWYVEDNNNIPDVYIEEFTELYDYLENDGDDEDEDDEEEIEDEN